MRVCVRVLGVLAVLLIGKVTLSVVIGYWHYLPPDFRSGFLLGREGYFWGPYRWAFYTHLVAGPTSLVLGTALVSERMRRILPRWHRRLGRVQAVCVLAFLTPSGLWMSYYAESGGVAGIGLAVLAIATATSVALGWKAALGRNWAVHRRWMWRTFMLLCSAVVIRVLGGLATVAQLDAAWIYPASVWTSWLAPLTAYEIGRRIAASPFGKALANDWSPLPLGEG